MSWRQRAHDPTRRRSGRADLVRRAAVMAAVGAACGLAAALGCGTGSSSTGFAGSGDDASTRHANAGDDAGTADPFPVIPPDDGGFPLFLTGDAALVEASCGDGAAVCLPGNYVGDFMGTIDLFQLFMVPITGTVNLTLSSTSTMTTMQTGSGEFIGTCTTTTLNIQNGHVYGQDNNNPPNYYAADIGGTLDCPSRKIINGYLANGTYQIGDAGGLGGLLPPAVFHFQGPFTGDYSPQTPPTLGGNWSVVVIGTGDGGTAGGTWSSKHQ